MNTTTKLTHETEIYGKTYWVQVGSYIEPERWFVGNKLEASDWDQAEFYLPTNNGGPIARVAVNVKITGRTFQYRSRSLWIKVQVEFVEDGFGPRVTTPGWLLVCPS